MVALMAVTERSCACYDMNSHSPHPVFPAFYKSLRFLLRSVFNNCSSFFSLLHLRLYSECRQISPRAKIYFSPVNPLCRQYCSPLFTGWSMLRSSVPYGEPSTSVCGYIAIQNIISTYYKIAQQFLLSCPMNTQYPVPSFGHFLMQYHK